MNLTRQVALFFVLCGSLLLIPAKPASANLDQPLVQPPLIVINPAAPATKKFGFALDQFDGNLLVGAAQGSAHIINVDNGSEILRVTSPETVGQEISFGDAVTQIGSMFAVSDSQLDVGGVSRVGSVYLFDGTTGQHVRTIRDPAPGFSSGFGTSLASVSEKLYISDQSFSTNFSGQVRTFDPLTGQLLSEISNPVSGWGFGTDIEEHNGGAFIGAAGAVTGSTAGGAVFRYDAGSTLPSLTIPIPSSSNTAQFGRSLDSRGNHLLVGAPGFNSSGVNRSGEAYLFDATTGALTLTIQNPEPTSHMNFGSSVALLDNYIVVGAPGADVNPGGIGAQNVGAFYLFDINTGDLVEKILNPIPSQNDQFTQGGNGNGGVFVVGNHLVASSYLRFSGLAFIYAVVPEPSSGLLFAIGIISTLGRRQTRRAAV